MLGLDRNAGSSTALSQRMRSNVSIAVACSRFLLIDALDKQMQSSLRAISVGDG
ncbi:hypothetical protein PILCRDRAFT_825996 [Piloderma croceum F 1598]|uniref:Uncharacterized protein n=1 Tax=Piloderma croceum (strain F 1598) TaxID=765440 RepID=A0A0C3FAK6_PILCF|nr:hypothetical protein PILCRDRAFT_825996 [Piloderma croceum F 1598]